MDIRIPSADYTIGGKTYHLTMNMNVLADLQEQGGGNILAVLDNKKTMKSGLSIGAALLNEAADFEGWPERFDAKTLGRMIPPRESIKFCEMAVGLFLAAVTDPDADSEEETEKNA